MLPRTSPHVVHEHSLLVDAQNTATPGSARLAVFGDLDALNDAALQDAVAAALRHHPAHLDLDLNGVTFLDTGGIRALLQCHADAERAGCRLTLTNPHPNVHRVLHIVGLLEHFAVAQP